MPKILLVANTDWYLYNYRLALVKTLRERGYEVVLVSPLGEYSSKVINEGFRFVDWQVNRKGTAPWEELRSIISLFRIYRMEKPDLVHHHTIKPVLYGSLAARWAQVPNIINSITGRGHVFYSSGLKDRIVRTITKILYRFSLRSPNIVNIYENQSDKDFFIESGFISPEQSHVIEGVGTDPDMFYPAEEPEGLPVVLMAGRMLWDKGVGVLVEAARILKAEMKIRVVLVGGPDAGNPGSVSTSDLKKWQEEGVVEWWGWRADMPAVYRSCHIVILPTTYGEGVPTTLIEGAACGKPLIASDIPGCTSIVHHNENGFLIPPENPEALARAISLLVADPNLRQKMGEEGRSLFLEKFTYKKVNEATIGIYERDIRIHTDENN